VGSKAGFRLALTGTVVENRLIELHSCFDFVLPRYLGNVKPFVTEFSKPIENDRDEQALALLKRMTEPFMLRRVKTDAAIIADLPEKIIDKHYVTLSKEQAALYESVRTEVFHAIDKEGPVGSGLNRSGLVLKLLGALKQVCNHPACYGDDPANFDVDRSDKCVAMLELVAPVIAAGEKILIFSQYVTMVRIIEKQVSAKVSTGCNVLQ
jgi:SNF2 family DNA or RNA helicase